MPSHESRLRLARVRVRARETHRKETAISSFKQALDIAARAFETDTPPRVTFIARKATPTFTLTLDRDGQHPKPGTLTVTEDGVRGQLFVGAIRYGAALQADGLADRARALQHIEVVSTAVTAGKEARAWLNRRWKLFDATEDGRLFADVAETVRDAV